MLKQELATFIEKNLLGDDRRITVGDTTALIEDGLIDSMGLMQIVLFLEERAGVRVPDDDVTPDNFETIVSIEAMADRLRSQQARR